MFNKKNLYFFLIFILFSCTTLKIEKKDVFDFSIKENESISFEEFGFDFYYKIFGIPIEGKVQIEDFFIHQDGFIFSLISFPQSGIIKSSFNDADKKVNFFKLKMLEEFFNNKEDEDKYDLLIKRTICKFSVSKQNKNKIALSCGPYIFLSDDMGDSWKGFKILKNNTSTIRDIFLPDENTVILVTSRNLFISNNWGKKWIKKDFKINNEKYEYISGIMHNQKFYISLKNINEKDSFLAKASYELLYNSNYANTKSGVFITDFLSDQWEKIDLNIPVILWEYNNEIYASTIYPLELYKLNFSNEFKNSNFFKKAFIDESSVLSVKEYLNLISSLSTDYFEIISLINNRIFNIKGRIFFIIEEKDFNNLLNGISCLQKLDYIQFDKNIYLKDFEKDFFYEYTVFRIFKRWTAMQTNSFSLYFKDDEIYRIRMNDDFFSLFVTSCFNDQVKLNRINPFLKKKTDIEFINTSILEKTKVPWVIERYTKNSLWEKIISDEKIKDLFSSVLEKCDEEYWFKNLEQKKNFRLQINFPSYKKKKLMVYPVDIKKIGDIIFIQLEFFSFDKSYKKIYKIKLDGGKK